MGYFFLGYSSAGFYGLMDTVTRKSTVWKYLHKIDKSNHRTSNWSFVQLNEFDLNYLCIIRKEQRTKE